MDVKRLLTLKRRGARPRPRQWTPRGTAWYDLLAGPYVVRVQFTPFRGFCVRSVYPRAGGHLDRLLILPPPEFSVKRIELLQQASQGRPSHLAPVESNVLTAFPNLVSHACVTRYDDGSSRRPGWWTVRTQGAAWIVSVKDPDSGCGLQATGQSLDDAMALAELLLGAEDAPWEPDPFLKQQGKKKG